MLNLPKLNNKSTIRKVEISGIELGNDASLPFMKENSNETNVKFAIEIPFLAEKNYPDVLKQYWQNNQPTFDKLLSNALETNCDFVCIHTNIDECDIETDSMLDEITEKIEKAVLSSSKPIIIKGSANKNIDKILLGEIAKKIKKQLIIANVEEATYEAIVPEIIKNGHILVLRSPIDINLAKELNILSCDLGMDPNKIIINPDLGALGYGLDYAYSTMEKIKLAALDGDTMLNMPMISFVGEETFKTKEAKTDSFDKSWGEHEKRAIIWEVATASAIISAGANLVVLSHPKSIEILKESLWN